MIAIDLPYRIAFPLPLQACPDSHRYTENCPESRKGVAYLIKIILFLLLSPLFPMFLQVKGTHSIHHHAWISDTNRYAWFLSIISPAHGESVPHQKGCLAWPRSDAHNAGHVEPLGPSQIRIDKSTAEKVIEGALGHARFVLAPQRVRHDDFITADDATTFRLGINVWDEPLGKDFLAGDCDQGERNSQIRTRGGVVVVSCLIGSVGIAKRERREDGEK